MGKWGGHRGVLPPSGFGPPLILPLSNHCLPHFLIFELEPPASKILNPLVEKFLTPKLKKNYFAKKGPNPLVEFWRLPLSGFSSWSPLPLKRAVRFVFLKLIQRLFAEYQYSSVSPVITPHSANNLQENEADNSFLILIQHYKPV